MYPFGFTSVLRLVPSNCKPTLSMHLQTLKRTLATLSVESRIMVGRISFVNSSPERAVANSFTQKIVVILRR
uniref:Uncharacterized protein n=1 Tax=Ciona intestinalis TaxID=7719 RepID=H2XSH3_CIOIN